MLLRREKAQWLEHHARTLAHAHVSSCFIMVLLRTLWTLYPLQSWTQSFTMLELSLPSLGVAMSRQRILNMFKPLNSSGRLRWIVVVHGTAWCCNVTSVDPSFRVLSGGSYPYPSPFSNIFDAWQHDSWPAWPDRNPWPRQSLIDPAMNWSSYVTTIDIAGELFGLSTLFLGVDFYRDSARDCAVLCI